MKTYEIRKILDDFCQKLEETKTDNDFNYKIEETYSQIEIEKSFKDEVGDNVVMVYKATNSYQILIDEIDGVTSDDLRAIFKAVKEYADTPLKERKDEKRWYIRFSAEINAYLNLRKDKELYFIGDKHGLSKFQTEYTRSEIEDWAGTSSDEIIDWIIGKFGEEVE